MRERSARAYYREPVNPLPAATSRSGAPRQPKPLYGAAAIAGFLKLKDKQVYRLVECHGERIPIRKVPGIGLASDEDVLSEWWERVIVRGEKP